MRRLALLSGLLLLAVASGCKRKAAAPGGAGPRVSEALEAQHTAGLLSLEFKDLPGSIAKALAELPPAQREDPNLKPMLDPQGRKEKLGFDPASAEGWRSIGVDPDPGIALVLDARVIGVEKTDTVPLPIVLAVVTDRARLLPVLERHLGDKIAISDQSGPSELVAAGGKVGLVGRRGAWTALVFPVLSPGTPHVAEARKRFDGFLSGSGGALAADATFKSAFADRPTGPPAAGLFATYASMSAIEALARAVAPEERSVHEAIAFYRGLFPAMGTFADPKESGARVLATPEGQKALARLLKPKKAAPPTARYLPKSSWAALRLSFNLAELSDGVAGVVPPAQAPVARAAVDLGRTTAGSALGTTWESIAAALSGHFLFAGDLSSIVAVATAGPGAAGWLAAIGVGDAAKADALVGKVLEAAAKLGQVSHSPTKVKGEGAFRVSAGPFQAAVMRHGDVILAAQSESALENALERARSDNLAAAPQGKALDGDVVTATVLDATPLIALAELGQQQAGFDASAFVAELKKNPLIAQTTRLDDRGLYSSGGTMGFAMMTGMGAALAIPAMVRYAELSRQAGAKGAPPQPDDDE